ncbi:MAG TPA: xanthine dehydrogenase family protein molybdopterin-binding subunit, partial [Ilumatobacter sp.]
MSATAAEPWVGRRIKRKEDPRLIMGRARYIDDINVTGQLWAAFVRSPEAHAKITSIDTSEAEGMPGVVGVFTAESLGLAPDASAWNPMVASTLLASDRVRYVGEPIVAVVAESVEQAVDAAEMVFVDYDVLDAVVDVESALASDTALFDSVPGNVVVDSVAFGMPDVSGDDFFADCEVTVSGTFVNQRVAPCPMETRSAA